MTASEAAERSGLAYQTAHRYLEYLVREGQLNRHAEIDENRSGRPRTIYSRPSDTEFVRLITREKKEKNN